MSNFDHARARLEALERRRLLSSVPVGPEFRVNTFTPDFQSIPSVAMDADGDHVVVWASLGQEGPFWGIYGQRYSAAGVPQGGELPISPSTSVSNNQFADVAISADGRFVVVWQRGGQNGDIYARRYDAAGVPQGEEFRVNTHTSEDQLHPSVAMDGDGDFVVTWMSDQQDGHSLGIYAQRYNAAGVAHGNEFRVNTSTSGIEQFPSVGVDADGDFVIVWDQFYREIYGQRYDASGTPQGGEFQVNTYTTDNQSVPSVALDADGDFVIAWNSRGQDGSDYGVYARRFDASGAAQGEDFRVNTYTTGLQGDRALAIEPDGDFVIAWDSFGQDGSESGVYARRFDAAGAPLGGEVRVNSTTTGLQGVPSVAVDANGNYVVTWLGRGPGDDAGVFAQRFAHDYPAVASSQLRYATAPHRLSITFDKNISPSLGSDDLIVENLTTGQTIPSSAFALAYDLGTNVATLTYTAGTGVLPDGRYRATLLASGTTLMADHAFEFTFLRGDANGDGRVNLGDFNILAANFGQSPRDFTQGDFDYNGLVNLRDFNILAGRFGAVAGPGGEPPARPGASRAADEVDELR